MTDILMRESLRQKKFSPKRARTFGEADWLDPACVEEALDWVGYCADYWANPGCNHDTIVHKRVVTGRKLRLFAVAMARVYAEHQHDDPEGRTTFEGDRRPIARALDASELCADELAPPEKAWRLFGKIARANGWEYFRSDLSYWVQYHPMKMVQAATRPSAGRIYRAIREKVWGSPPLPGHTTLVGLLLNDIFGDSFRQATLERQALPDDAVRMAQSAYDEGFPDPHALAVIGDALEDSGLGDEAMLRHLRGFVRCFHKRPSPKCRKCRGTGWAGRELPYFKGDWTIDEILGKTNEGEDHAALCRQWETTS